MRNIFINLAQSGTIKAMSYQTTVRSASKPNGSSQAGHRRRAKQSMSNSGRTRGRVK